MSQIQRKAEKIQETTVPLNSSANKNLANKTNVSETQKEPLPVVRKAEMVSDEAKAVVETTQFFDLPEDQEYSETGIWSRVFWYFVFLVATWLCFEIWISLNEVWAHGPWVAGPVTFLTVSFVLMFCWGLFREYRAYKRVEQLDELRESVMRFKRENSLQDLQETLAPTLSRLELRYPEVVKSFQAAASSRTNPQEYLSLLQNTILAKLDKDAEQLIKKEAMTVGGAVAIAPHPSLDFVIVVWRSVRLIRKMGEIYGLEPTGLSSLRIFKHMITSAITAAGMEKIGSLAVGTIGLGVMESTGKNLLEGAVLSTRIYRLGKMVQQSVRPIEMELKA